MSAGLGRLEFGGRPGEDGETALGLTLSLLPILLAYTLISLLHHGGPSDENSYLRFAAHLTHGYYAQTNVSAPGAYLWHGPGLPGLLAPLVWLHVPLSVMRVLVGPVLLFAAMVVFYGLMRLYLEERAALIATYGLALYLPFVEVVGQIWAEPLATLCFTLGVFFLVRAYRGGRRDPVWAGVAWAVLALSRVEYGYALTAGLLLSGVWLLGSRRSTTARQTTLALTVALLLCTPWLIYTYSLTGKPFYWGNSGGLSIYWNIEHDPTHYLSDVVDNLGRLIFNSPYSFTNEKASLMLYAIPNALLLSLVTIAAALAIKVRRRLKPEVLPIAALTALGFVVHVPVAAYARFVIPLAPVTIWLAVAVIAPNVRLTPELALSRSDAHA